MADFDPDAYLAGETAVAAPPAFDPDAYLSVKAPAFNPDEYLRGSAEIQQADEQAAMERDAATGGGPQSLKNATEAATETLGGFIPHSIGDVAGLVSPLPSAIHDLKKAYQIGKDVLTSDKPFEESIRKYSPEDLALLDAGKTEAYSKERFKAGFDVVAQMLMAAGIVKGMKSGHGEIPPERLSSEPSPATDAPSPQSASMLPEDVSVSSSEARRPMQEQQSQFAPQPDLTTGGVPEQAPSVPDAPEAVEPPGSPKVVDETPIAQPASDTTGQMQSQPTSTTGVANRVLDAEAKAGRIDPVESGEGMSWQEMVDLGRQQMNAGADPQMIARRFERNGRISAPDFAVIRAERERLAIETNKAADAVKAAPGDPVVKAAYDQAKKVETDWIQQVVQPAKTATSNIFRGMQGEAPIDASTFEGLRRSFVDTTGKEPGPYQETVMRFRANRVRQAQGAERAALGKLSQHIEKEFPNIKTPSLEQLRSEMQKMARELTPCNL